MDTLKVADELINKSKRWWCLDPEGTLDSGLDKLELAAHQFRTKQMYEEAMNVYDKLGQLHTVYPWKYYLLADEMAKKISAPREEYLTKAIEGLCNNGNFYQAAGVYLTRGDVTQNPEDYLSAIELYGDSYKSEKVKESLAKLYFSKGMYKKSADTYASITSKWDRDKWTLRAFILYLSIDSITAGKYLDSQTYSSLKIDFCKRLLEATTRDDFANTCDEYNLHIEDDMVPVLLGIKNNLETLV